MLPFPNDNVRLLGCSVLPKCIGEIPLVWDPQVLDLGCDTHKIKRKPLPSEVWQKDGIHLPMPEVFGTDFQLDVHRLPGGGIAIHQRTHPKAPCGAFMSPGPDRTNVAFLGTDGGGTFISNALPNNKWFDMSYGDPWEFAKILEQGQYDLFQKTWVEEMEKNYQRWKDPVQDFRDGHWFANPKPSLKTIWNGVEDHTRWEKLRREELARERAVEEAAIVSPARRALIAATLATATSIQLLALRTLLLKKAASNAVVAFDERRFDADAIAQAITDEEIIATMTATRLTIDSA